MSLRLHLDGEPCTLQLTALRPEIRCRSGEVEHTFRLEPGPEAGCWRVQVDGEVHLVWRVLEGDRVHVRVAGQTHSIRIEDPLVADGRGALGDELRAEMPGMVVAVGCGAGDTVIAGQYLLTIESMKMQLSLVAPRAGIVAAVHVGINETFQKGTLLLALHPEEDA